MKKSNKNIISVVEIGNKESIVKLSNGNIYKSKDCITFKKLTPEEIFDELLKRIEELEKTIDDINDWALY